MMIRVASGSAVAASRAAPLRAAAASSRGLSSLFPLDEEYLGTPGTMPTAAAAPVTKVSTLSNGATVVTHASSQLGASVGVVVGSGSRDESAAQAGASLQLEGMAYKLTQARSSIRLMRDVENAGGNLAASRGREKASPFVCLLLFGTMMYVSECPPDSAGDVLSALAESVVSPKIVPWEMADATAKLSQIILHRHAGSTSEQVDDALHAAAFGDYSTLGKPLTPGRCSLSADGLKQFRDLRYKASGMTVVGVNVCHDEFKSQAEAALGAADTSPAAVRTASKYLGGELRVKNDVGTTSVSIAFASPPGAHSSAPAYEALAALFNARAAAAAANTASTASGFNVTYSDVGLVGVTGTCENGGAAAMTEALASCFLPPSDAEVESAIIYAKISRGLKMEKPIDALLALADSASVGADPAACVSALDSVTVQGVKAAASAAFQSGMSMAAVGNISEVPHKEEVAAML
eukprot:jgi/Undpi1/10427/HiC_scaffold_29.g12877.m1